MPFLCMFMFEGSVCVCVYHQLVFNVIITCNSMGWDVTHTRTGCVWMSYDRHRIEAVSIKIIFIISLLDGVTICDIFSPLLFVYRSVLWCQFVTFHMSASKCASNTVQKKSREVKKVEQKSQPKVNFDCSLFSLSFSLSIFASFSSLCYSSSLLAASKKIDRNQSNEFNALAWETLALYLILLCSQLVAISYRTAHQIEFNS